jgi:hypothetical protein
VPRPELHAAAVSLRSTDTPEPPSSTPSALSKFDKLLGCRGSLADEQTAYLNVSKDGPDKPEHYRY